MEWIYRPFFEINQTFVGKILWQGNKIYGKAIMNCEPVTKQNAFNKTHFLLKRKQINFLKRQRLPFGQIIISGPILSCYRSRLKFWQDLDKIAIQIRHRQIIQLSKMSHFDSRKQLKSDLVVH